MGGEGRVTRTETSESYERFEICHAPVSEIAWVYDRRRAHAGARRRGEHCHLQRCEYSLAEGAAVSRSGTCRDAMDGQPVLESWISRTPACAARLARLAQPGAFVRADRRFPNKD